MSSPSTDGQSPRFWRALTRRPLLIVAFIFVALFEFVPWKAALPWTKQVSDRVVADVELISPLTLASRYVTLFTSCDPVDEGLESYANPDGDCSWARYVSLTRPFVVLIRVLGEASADLSTTGHVIFGVITLLSLIGGFVLSAWLARLTDGGEATTVFLGFPMIPVAFWVLLTLFKWTVWIVFSVVGVVAGLLIASAALVAIATKGWSLAFAVHDTAKTLENLTGANIVADAAPPAAHGGQPNPKV